MSRYPSSSPWRPRPDGSFTGSPWPRASGGPNLEQLVWGDVLLLPTRPAVQLRAEATKARRPDRVGIPQTLADDLRALRPPDAKDSDRVFPAVPPIEDWKADLAAAGIPYMDDMGRQADFHGGTRKTLCTRMHRAGVPLAVAMRKMRHTDSRLTLVDYTDDDGLEMDAAVLPELPPATARQGDRVRARWAGTTGGRSGTPTTPAANNPEPGCLPLSPIVACQ